MAESTGADITKHLPADLQFSKHPPPPPPDMHVSEGKTQFCGSVLEKELFPTHQKKISIFFFSLFREEIWQRYASLTIRPYFPQTGKKGCDADRITNWMNERRQSISTLFLSRFERRKKKNATQRMLHL